MGVPSSSPSKPQLAIYAAFAIAVLLIGARFLRHGSASSPPDASAPPAAFATATTTARAGAAGASPDGLGAAGDAGAQVVVDVEGAVRRPGVYRLPAGARADDAIRRAGGLTSRADRVGVNLAARVPDGGEVIVPERGAGGRGVAAGGSPTGASGAGGGGGAGSAGRGSAGAPLSLDLDTATEQQLEQLDGVGPALAAKIVAYREQHGGIASVDDLDNVSGIGPAKLAAIRAQLGR